MCTQVKKRGRVAIRVVLPLCHRSGSTEESIDCSSSFCLRLQRCLSESLVLLSYWGYLCSMQQLKNKKQTETEMLYGSAPRTPSKRPGQTPNKCGKVRKVNLSSCCCCWQGRGKLCLLCLCPAKKAKGFSF